MISFIINAIKKTHFDILGLPLFIVLVIYFLMIADKTLMEWFLLGSCVLAMSIDGYYNWIWLQNIKNTNANTNVNPSVDHSIPSSGAYL